MDNKKSPEVEAFLDNLGFSLFNRSRGLAIAGQSCIMCGKPAVEFDDELSRKEFSISGACHQCQHKMFGGCD